MIKRFSEQKVAAKYLDDEDIANPVPEEDRGNRWIDDNVVASDLVGSRAICIFEVPKNGWTIRVSQSWNSPLTATVYLGTFDSEAEAEKVAKKAGAKHAVLNPEYGDDEYVAVFSNIDKAWDYAAKQKR